ncbi:hypothetical protein [Sphingomonas jeddahensis]|uniref:Uncharacterized protein n=1 Tax=Sphingomonas jeddahensis TaxID=1915074 RepID=A0A1V2ETS7_9SPHN|nr:hypothetical protein [Sphingomonas jeddahensis]ONF95897.1 hypothetical protein SPHI_18230 [Sphingomonas jeddahensis]
MQRLTRYQKVFVREIQRLDAAVSAKDRVGLEARAANAMRQMGQFRVAEGLRQQAEQSLDGMTEKEGWNIYLSRLTAPIARHDSSIEPLDMIPTMQVAFACARVEPASTFDRTACAEPEVAEKVRELRRIRQKNPPAPR